jgi:hypothetical protein
VLLDCAAAHFSLLSATYAVEYHFPDGAVDSLTLTSQELGSSQQILCANKTAWWFSVWEQDPGSMRFSHSYKIILKLGLYS